MLSCKEFAHRYASDHLDGQLYWRQRVGVRLHLLLCDNCRRFVAQLREVRAVLHRRRAEPVAPATDDRALQDLAGRLGAVYDAQKKTSPPL